MNTSLIILLILIAIGGGVYYYLSLRPGSKSFLKESYSEGLDLLVSGQRREAYQHFSKILNNNDLLMVKGSNATGLNRFSQNFKKGSTSVI